MEKRDRIKDAVQLCIDRLKDKLRELSRDIWSCPELAYKETRAHDRLVRFFSEEEEWRVESQYKLATAFRATWGPVGGKEGDEVLNIGFLCEYDALPGIGHACGHNLIAEVGAAAALGLAGALGQEPDLPVPVKVTPSTLCNTQRAHTPKHLVSVLNSRPRGTMTCVGRQTQPKNSCHRQIISQSYFKDLFQNAQKASVQNYCRLHLAGVHLKYISSGPSICTYAVNKESLICLLFLHAFKILDVLC